LSRLAINRDQGRGFMWSKRVQRDWKENAYFSYQGLHQRKSLFSSFYQGLHQRKSLFSTCSSRTGSNPHAICLEAKRNGKQASRPHKTRRICTFFRPSGPTKSNRSPPFTPSPQTN